MSGVSRAASAALLAAALLGACAGPPAEDILSYGTPGVSSYLPAGEAESLPALMERCRVAPASAGPPRSQSLEAPATSCTARRGTSRATR